VTERPSISVAASPAYRRGVWRLLLGLVGFALTYLGLIVGSVSAVVVAVSWALQEAWLWPAAIFVLLVFTPLCVFLLHGLFHRPRPSGAAVSIDAREHPRLLALVESLASAAGTSLPSHITLSAGVNAAMVAGLGRHELVIGLGLVNVLDVRELEAVLAHEFGHFGQSSMRVGQWAQRVTLLLRAVVLGRTRLDMRLARARSSRSWSWRTIAAITAVGIQGIRRTLGWLLGHVIRRGRAFSRELEFNADLHAVALCGSDALVSALWRAQRGALAMNAALGQLAELGKHGVFSEDVYAHQQARLAQLDERLARASDPMSSALRRPYRRGPQLHFPPGETPAEVMWYAHPSYREREANAKRNYVEVDAKPADSAWSLFEQPAEVRRTLTLQAYAELLGRDRQPVQLRSVDEVEDRIVAELAEREQGAHYHGFYDNRLVDPGPIDELTAELERSELDVAGLRAEAEAWRGPQLATFMLRWRESEARLEWLRGIAGGRIEVAAAQLRAAPGELARAEAERETMIAEAHRGDRAVLRHAWAVADADVRAELVERYRFLAFVQRHIAVLNAHHAAVGHVSSTIDARDYEHAADAPVELLAILDALHRDLVALLDQARSVALPQLRNLEAGRELASVLTAAPVLEPLAHDAELEPWLRRLMPQVREVHVRLRTLHYKNLGALLSLHERIDAGSSSAAE
jgi:Zn-dependent protease with chaperone function